MGPEAAPATIRPLISLPIVGDTSIEDAVFYVAVGAAAAAGVLQWPTAGLFASLHALHQRARNVTRSGAVAEVREGLIEAADELL